MYNEEQKVKFAKQFTDKITVRDNIRRIFDAIEPFEEKWGADLCTRSSEELQPAFDAVAGLRNGSRRVPMQILQAYVRWCIEQGIPGACDGMLHVRSIGAEKIARQMISTPSKLQWYLNQICEPESEQTTDNTVRALLWLAFAGMKEEDAFRIRVTDVDFLSAVVRYNGVEYPIYRDAFPAFRNCVELKRFVYIHPNYGAGETHYRDRVDGDYLLRGFRAMPLPHTMQVEVSRRAKRAVEDGKTDILLSYSRVWLSGVFYRMWEREQAGMPVDFDEQALRYAEGKTYKLSAGRNLQSAKHRAIARDFEADYQRWKQIFK